ncbi:MAG: nitroreductase family protein [Nanoarchaeota archaeon]|nr:nitroreductase family protein [Nanoarchaeota archaeon]
MNTFQAIESRRSVRQYQNRPVELDDLLMIAEMGMHGPTSGDLQDTRFIIVREKEAIEKVAEMCLEQLWMTSAPSLLVVCSQPSVQAEWYGERGRHVFSAQNAAAAMENALLAATDLGLATCWVGGFDQEKIDDFFGVGDARVEGIITVGYAAETPEKKEMHDHLTTIYFENYGNDKIDMDLLNKDYSKKIEKKLKETQKKAATFQEQAKKYLDQAKVKAKEVHKKYVLKK